MMTNLFSIFDPATPNFASANWAALCLGLAMIPAPLWKSHSRSSFSLNKLYSYILKEFYPLIKKSPFILTLVFSVFMFIVWNNMFGLMPYIFTPTSHMAIALPMSLSIWLAITLFGWINYSAEHFEHLIPQGTPMILTPFMVVIETVSAIIRPATLAIRLSANMTAGHLLIVLLSSASPITPLMGLPALLAAQIALSMLEVAVALVQGYVFSVLVTLYASEAVN